METIVRYHLADGVAAITLDDGKVNVFGLAMRCGISATQVRDNIYAYPTFASDIKHMLGHA